MTGQLSNERRQRCWHAAFKFHLSLPRKNGANAQPGRTWKESVRAVGKRIYCFAPHCPAVRGEELAIVKMPVFLEN